MRGVGRMPAWRRIVEEVHQKTLWQVLGVYLFAGWAAFQVIYSLHEAIGLPIWAPRFALVLLIAGLPIVLATAIVQADAPRPDARAVSDSGTPRDKTGAASGSADGPAPAGEGALARESTTAPVQTADQSAGDSGGERSTAKGSKAAPTGLQSLLTWRRSLVGGFAAFSALAIATAGFMFVRNRNTLLAQGVLDAQDVIVLADFESTGADPTLGGVVTEALRIDLVTSNLIRLADASRIGATLSRMQLDPETPLSADVAREVAARDGIKAVLLGDISSLGGGYSLTARLVTPADSTLAAFRSAARDSTGLIDAVDDLSRQVRDKVGESLKTINARPPLEDVSTGSLPALRKYVEAQRVLAQTGDALRSLELLDEALALDSTFAMAWRKKGVVLGNVGIRQNDQVEALTRAYDLNERLPEKERYLAIATYEAVVNSDQEAALPALRRVLEIDPEDATALNNIAVALMDQRQYAEAEPYVDRASRLPSASQVNFNNLIEIQYRLGRFDDAQATVERGLATFPNNPEMQRREVYVAAAQQRWETVDSLARARAERYRENFVAQVMVLFDRTSAATIEGRLRDAETYFADLDDRAVMAGLLPQQLFLALSVAQLSLKVRRDQERGWNALQDALTRFPLDSVPELERPYRWIAMLYADAGRFDLADAMIQRALQERPPGPSADEWVATERAYIAMLQGDPKPGLEQFRIASSYPEEGSCRVCELDLLGQAYEVAGQPDSARAVYERFLTEPEYDRLDIDPLSRPWILERVAALHELAGDTAQALVRYGEFVNLWENADPELQDRVEAARRRVAALRGAG